MISDLLQHIPTVRISRKASQNASIRDFAHYHAELRMTMPRHSGLKKSQAMIIVQRNNAQDELVTFFRRIGRYGLPSSPETRLIWSSAMPRLRLRAYRLVFSQSAPFTSLHEGYMLQRLGRYLWNYQSFSVENAKDTSLATRTQKDITSVKWTSVQHLIARMAQSFGALPDAMEHSLDAATYGLDSMQYQLESTLVSEQGIQWLSSDHRAGPDMPNIDVKSLFRQTYHLCLTRVFSESAEACLRYAAAPSENAALTREQYLDHALIACNRALVTTAVFPVDNGSVNALRAQIFCREARAFEAKGDLAKARQSIRTALQVEHTSENVEHAVRIEKAWREQQEKANA